MTIHELSAQGIRVALDAEAGHIAGFEIVEDGRILAPLHRAPWVADADQEFPEGTPENVRHLSGDFLCAPFGRNDVEPAPTHGWPANSPWDLVGSRNTAEGAEAVFVLRRKVFGARVVKKLVLRHGHPFLYQEHRFEGGEGAVSAAHHVMVRMSGGGEIAVSPKLFAETPATPLEPDPARGRHALAYPANREGFGTFPLSGVGEVDLRHYPPASAHEDFLTLAERPENALGWTVVSRRAERDHLIVLKNPAILPITMMWMSNGGRDYAPWSSRHTGVLGIEDACASPLGHRDSIAENDFTRRGIATAFDLSSGGVVTIRQVIGICAAGSSEERATNRVMDVVPTGDRLELRFDEEPTRRLPFDAAFLAGS